VRTYESELDERVAKVCDRLESEELNGAQAVTALREATGLCPCLAAGLLKREMCRRRQAAVDHVAGAARGVLREVGRDDDGTWTP